MKNIKKIITAIAISVLSLVNGFAYTHKEMTHLAELSQPLQQMAALGEAFEQCPDVVAAIAKQKNIKIDLDEARRNTVRIYSQSQFITKRGIGANYDPLLEVYGIIVLREQCLNLGVTVPYFTPFPGKTLNCISNTDQKIIECLLRAYSPRLIRQAEELILEAKRHDIL